MTITVSCIPSRSTITQGEGVFFDISGTTSTNTTKPFREIYYQWNYGDPDSGSYAYGSPTNNNKNFDARPNGGHVYDTAGVKTVTLAVNDGTETVLRTLQITVNSADSVFPTTNTICINNVGDANFDGKPTGAAEVNSDDFDAVVTAQKGNGKRLLFKRGGTWASSTTVNLGALVTAQIGAYGAGAKPIITLADNVALTANSGSLSAFVVRDLRVTGSGTSGQGFFQFGSSPSYVTALGCESNNTRFGMECTGTGENVVAQLTVHECNFQDMNGGAGNGLFLYSTQFIMSGNYINNSVDGEHIARIMQSTKGVIRHNTLSNAGFGRHVLKLCAPSGVDYAGTGSTASKVITLVTPNPSAITPGTLCFGSLINGIDYVASSTANSITLTNSNAAINGAGSMFVQQNTGVFTEYTSIADNIFIGNSGVDWIVNLGPQDTTADQRLRKNVPESNIYQTTGGTQIALYINATETSVRNEIFDLTGSPVSGERKGIVVEKKGIEPTPNDVSVCNCTIYSGDTDNAFIGITLGTGVTGAVAKNNLGYAPNDSLHNMISDSSTGADVSNNSSDAQVLQDPLFTGPLTVPQGFRIATTSYGQNAGTPLFPSGYADFINADDVTANVAIGAFVPRVRASCKSVAA